MSSVTSSSSSSSSIIIPIIPSSPSLQSHLSALDILSLRLSNLTSSTTHSARIPLIGKASIRGDIVHTNDIKVNIGREWWIDMTAQEASEYVKRRKDYLLLEHARLLEGKSRPYAIDALSLQGGESNIRDKEGMNQSERYQKVGFHPIFYDQPVAGPSKSPLHAREANPVESSEEEDRSASSAEKKKDIKTSIEPSQSSTKSIEQPRDVINPIKQSQQPKTPPEASLVDILDERGTASGQHDAAEEDTTLNEEGLPFHEIRETLSGETIGAPPPPNNEASTASIEEKEEDDYFSSEAVARRAALRRKLFNESSSSEGEDDDDDDNYDTQVKGKSNVPGVLPIKAKGGIIHAKPIGKEPTLEQFQNTSLLSQPERRLSSSSGSSMPIQTKSILKPPKPPTRKKSVTFDPSLPSPPDSPMPSQSHAHSQIGRFGFPLPLAVDDDTHEFTEKSVPVIPTPQPRQKKDDNFAGFKKGFLSPTPTNTISNTNASQSSSNPSAITKKHVNEAVKSIVPEKPIPSTTSSSSSAITNDQNSLPKPKKQSLFSQRLSQPEIDASAPSINTTTSTRIPNLPKVSESKGTTTLKSGVIEKPPIASTSAVQSVVKENSSSPITNQDNLKIIERPLKIAEPEIHKASISQIRYDGNDDDDGDDGEEDDEFSEYSTGEEDEYDLDEALLAREVALEYHRRQAYKPLNRDPEDYIMGEEDNDQDQKSNDDAERVMLGLPRISDVDPEGNGPMIINPTPDDLRRFVRIGRLENGNLVLAPGEESLDTDESENENEDDQGGAGANQEERDNRRKRKENRETIKRQLMGLEVPSSVSNINDEEKRRLEKSQRGRQKVENDWKNSLPPTLTSSSPRNEIASGSAMETTPPNATKMEKPRITSKPPIIPLASESSPSSPVETITPSLPVSAPNPLTQKDKDPEKPKKISKFKAARIASNQ
ncbi:uncharacterized protein IL334_004775 [Kwoniella shivajii]|uniref:FHA domain-containing protein n=1 Tax=Kwoniella shivajii TaxID=564305 RepID=A0ABZ1D1N4_9TREE|nr:hypothetical protein IL334_004775 [Kwoniella shivajii]